MARDSRLCVRARWRRRGRRSLAAAAGAGVVIDRLSPGAVLLLAAGLVAIGGLLVAGIRPIGPSITTIERSPEVAPGRASWNVGELLGGFAALARLPGPRTVVLVLGAAA